MFWTFTINAIWHGIYPSLWVAILLMPFASQFVNAWYRIWVNKIKGNPYMPDILCSFFGALAVLGIFNDFFIIIMVKEFGKTIHFLKITYFKCVLIPMIFLIVHISF